MKNILPLFDKKSRSRPGSKKRRIHKAKLQINNIGINVISIKSEQSHSYFQGSYFNELRVLALSCLGENKRKLKHTMHSNYTPK